ncbi:MULTISPECIES: GNAT family N-acetyltransferase [unclassified Rhizobium]|uniref:GNAT family N-acetyltransferase n=1 Tax=unclassified Rhizobium TaxID=2613769 RepID=UPI001FCD83AC|nr:MULTISPECIES: GNAT family N-acetyltransferase [unclassified Rhizobium]
MPIQAGEFGFSITAADQPDLADIDGFYRRGRGGFWVADDGGRIVGTIALRDLGDGQGALRKMFVAASHRGASHRGSSHRGSSDRGLGDGIAQRLLDILVQHAAANGFSVIVLGTTDRFVAAHRFYEKNGFATVDAGDLPAGFP